MSEAVVNRIAGAVRFVHAATRRPVTGRLQLSADPRIEWRQSRSGDWVVWRAAGLDSYTGHDPALGPDAMEALVLAPPDPPAEESATFEVTVEDPSGAFVGRRFQLKLPRKAAAAAGELPDLYKPVEVKMYPAAGGAAVGYGAEIYGIVHDGDERDGRLPGALVTVKIDGIEVSGLTGPNGEALVVVPRLASFSAGGGGGVVVVTEHEAELRAAVRPELVEKQKGRWTLVRAPDPERDFGGAGVKTATATVKISAGKTIGHSFSVAMT